MKTRTTEKQNNRTTEKTTIQGKTNKNTKKQKTLK